MLTIVPRAYTNQFGLATLFSLTRYDGENAAKDGRSGLYVGLQISNALGACAVISCQSDSSATLR